MPLDRPPSGRPDDPRRFDAPLSLTMLAVLYGAASILFSAVASFRAGAEVGVLAFLLALTLGLAMAGATAILTMAVQDLRRAAGVLTS